MIEACPTCVLCENGSGCSGGGSFSGSAFGVGFCASSAAAISNELAEGKSHLPTSRILPQYIACAGIDSLPYG
jgi:hypothetical protein